MGIKADIYAQDQMKFAEYLYKDHDYFRAISIYKQIMFFTDDVETKNHCLFQIIKAYYKSNKYKASIQYTSRLLNQPQLPDWYLIKAQIYLGLNYYGLKLYPMAEDYFNRVISSDTTGFALYYLGLLNAESQQWKKASEIYEEVYQKYPQTRIGQISSQLSQDVIQGYNIPRKNPTFASILSTFIPGSGQIYSHHYYDGIQAFLFVGAFSYATFAAYRYDKNFNNNFLTTYVALSITAIFHLANIIGANRTANYYNLQQKEKFMTQIREKVFIVED